ncbi:MAG: lipopolysaccharide heptosyltransferase II [Simkaniaceae bacterium]|nr:lipopolysaccharide heptosyltransferase II [Simkaniaceae bacterium]
MKILVRMPNWLGDIVMATPVLALIRKKYPEGHLTALLPQSFAPLLQGDPHLNEVTSSLKKGEYDLGFLLTNSFSSAYAMYKAGVKCRVGYSGDWRRLFLTEAVSFSKKRKEQHLVKTYQELLGGDGTLLPTLYLDEKEKEWAREFLKSMGITGRVIGVHVGASYGPAKCWPASKFRSLAKVLSKENCLLFFGDAGTHEKITQITEGLPSSVVNLAGKTTIRELMALMKSCHVILSNDSGPMHIADALGIPLIALFGSTDPRVTGPYRSQEVIWKEVSCSPCFKKTCPIDFRCMRSIMVKEVLEKVESVGLFV